MYDFGLFAGYKHSDLPDDVWARIKKVFRNINLCDVASVTQYGSVADAVFLKLGGTFDAEMFEAFSRLKLIGMLGTGYGRVNISRARQKGVAVFNISDYATDAVAEFVFATALARVAI